MLRRPQCGFTLVELLVTVALLAIVLSIGVPSFEGVGNSSRLSSTTNELSGAIQLARAEAIRQNSNVVLCRTDDLAMCTNGTVWRGWMIFVDTNGDDQANNGEEIIRSGTLDAAPEVQASPAIVARSSRITFLPTGRARAGSVQTLLTATLSVCMASTRPPENARELNLAFGGRVSVQSKNTGGVCAQPTDS